MEPTKENSLYLTIKQVYFDQIIAGTKTCEYREISFNTYKKYVESDKEGWPLFNTDVISEKEADKYDPQDSLNIYNNGSCPLVHKQSIKYLNLAVGYNKVRDTATVEVKDITFEVMKGRNGKEARFEIDKNGNLCPCDTGKLCIWQAVFHLGAVVTKNIISK